MKLTLTPLIIYNFIYSKFGIPQLSNISYTVNSPFVDDKKRKLYIHAKKGFYHCFKSGESGNFKKLVEHIDGVKFYGWYHFLRHLYSYYDFIDDEAQKFYYSNEKRILSEDEIPKSISQQDVKIIHPDMKQFSEFTFDLNQLEEKPFLDYLNKRHISNEKIKKFGLMYDKHRQRIVLPVFLNGKVVNYQMRYIGKNPNEKKYLFPKSSTVTAPKFLWYNYDEISGGQHDTIVVTEGQIDAMTDVYIGNKKIPVLATFGKENINSYKMDLLIEANVNNIIFAFDYDKYFINSVINYYNKIKTHIANFSCYVIDWRRLKQDYLEVLKRKSIVIDNGSLNTNLDKVSIDFNTIGSRIDLKFVNFIDMLKVIEKFGIDIDEK